MALLGIIVLIYGLCEAFLGYKVYQISLFLTGVLVGICTSAIICKGIILTVLLSIPLGILCGILSVVLLRVGIFLHCFFCGVMGIMVPEIVSTLADLANVEGIMTVGLNFLQTGRTGIDFTSSLPLALVIGMVAGVVGLIFAKIILIVSSAAIGGMACGIGICLILVQPNPWIIGIVGILIMVLGIRAQLRMNPRKEKQTVVQNAILQNTNAAPQLITTSSSVNVKRFCSQCGAECNELIRFCAKCGNKLS